MLCDGSSTILYKPYLVSLWRAQFILDVRTVTQFLAHWKSRFSPPQIVEKSYWIVRRLTLTLGLSSTQEDQ